MSDIEGALAAAREAESWSMTVEFGADVSWLDDDTFDLSARTLNTIVSFLPPDANHPSWRIASGDVVDDDEALEEIDDELDRHDTNVWDLELLGDVPAATVTDAVPSAAEAFVPR